MSRIIKARFIINDKTPYQLETPGCSKPCFEPDSPCAARETADEIYNETRVMIEELLHEAQKKADTILLEAKEKAQALLDENRAQCAVLKERAYEEGFKQGHLEGQNKAEEELRPVYQAAGECLRTLQEQTSTYLKKHDNELVSLVIALFEKTIGILAEIKPDIIGAIVIKALENIKDAEKLLIKINPIHTPYLALFEEQYKERFRNRVQLVEDETIKPGDCQLITENGFLESKIEEQLSIIKNALLEVVNDVGN